MYLNHSVRRVNITRRTLPLTFVCHDKHLTLIMHKINNVVGLNSAVVAATTHSTCSRNIQAFFISFQHHLFQHFQLMIKKSKEIFCQSARSNVTPVTMLSPQKLPCVKQRAVYHVNFFQDL